MNLKCECGGTLRPVEIERFDFSGFAGLSVELQKVPGLRCDECGGETLEGKIIDAVLHLLAEEVLMLPRVLHPLEAKYLRKRLRLSQKELAQKMGIQRETVAAWECGTKSLSPQNDFILRALLVGGRRTAGTETFAAHVLTRALGEVHIPGRAPAAPEPFVISEQLKKVRKLAARSQATD